MWSQPTAIWSGHWCGDQSNHVTVKYSEHSPAKVLSPVSDRFGITLVFFLVTKEWSLNVKNRKPRHTRILMANDGHTSKLTNAIRCHRDSNPGRQKRSAAPAHPSPQPLLCATHSGWRQTGPQPLPETNRPPSRCRRLLRGAGSKCAIRGELDRPLTALFAH